MLHTMTDVFSTTNETMCGPNYMSVHWGDLNKHELHGHYIKIFNAFNMQIQLYIHNIFIHIILIVQHIVN